MEEKQVEQQEVKVEPNDGRLTTVLRAFVLFFYVFSGTVRPSKMLMTMTHWVKVCSWVPDCAKN